MSEFSKVKQRGFSELKPTSFLEVGAIAPERASAGKGFLALWGQCVAGLQQVLWRFWLKVCRKRKKYAIS
jgi:hypothetical protein